MGRWQSTPGVTAKATTLPSRRIGRHRNSVMVKRGPYATATATYDHDNVDSDNYGDDYVKGYVNGTCRCRRLQTPTAMRGGQDENSSPVS